MTPEHDIFCSSSFQELLNCLQLEPCGEDIADWPGHHLDAMAKAGVMKCDIPEEFGGIDLGPSDMLEGLRLLSAASLVSTFVLTQRSAAVRRIATSSNTVAQAALLPGLLSGELFATVGISHLTTSGQHLNKPLVSVKDTGDAVLLSGTVPWATGANHADYIITGGTLEDGRQILAAVATSARGYRGADACAADGTQRFANGCRYTKRSKRFQGHDPARAGRQGHAKGNRRRSGIAGDLGARDRNRQRHLSQRSQRSRTPSGPL